MRRVRQGAADFGNGSERIARWPQGMPQLTEGHARTLSFAQYKNAWVPSSKAPSPPTTLALRFWR